MRKSSDWETLSAYVTQSSHLEPLGIVFEYDRTCNPDTKYQNLIVIDSGPFFKGVEENTEINDLLFEDGESSQKLRVLWDLWISHAINTECVMPKGDSVVISPSEIEMTRV